MTTDPQAGREHVESHLPKDLKELGELAHLLFEWPIQQAPRLALPACILLAMIIQGGMIVLFSISYTSPSEILPNAPQVYFIPPDSAVAHRLAPWLAANDPAVFSPQYDTRDALPAPPPLKYRPSYEEPPPPLRPLPADAVIPINPPLLPRMADLLGKKSHPPTTAESPAVTPSAHQTVVHWQDDLAPRQLIDSPAGMPPLPPPFAQSSMAQPALYEVEVSAEGLPMHSLLLESSGDSASDEAGSVWIHSQRFQAAARSSWGRVLLLWGTPGATATQASSPTPITTKP